MRLSLAVFGALFVSIVVAGVSGAARAETAAHDVTSASCAGAVSWQNARRVVGRVATIRGNVAGTYYAASSNGSPTFLNLGADYPSPRRVTVVIWQENRARFGRPELRYRGRTICVHGYVDTYRGVPDLEATSPAQIAVVG
jgi:hypothetical protein